MVEVNYFYLSLFYIIIIMIALFFAAIPAKIVNAKGEDFWLWYFYTLFFSPIAFIHAFILRLTTGAIMSFLKSSKEENSRTQEISQKEKDISNEYDKLRELSKLKEDGIITVEEFEQVKKNLLNSISN